MEEKAAAEVYEDEINSLKEEIRMLEEQYESKQQEVLLHTDKKLLKKIEIYQAKLIGDFGGGCNPADLKAKLHEMKSEIRLVTKLTGIKFTEYIKTFERTDDGKPIRKHRICGYCLSLPFQLEFKTVEEEVKDILAARILDLNIIMDCKEYASLSSFISKAEETKSLLLFFRTLSVFAEWCEHRRTTFRHFKVKYPECIKLPEGFRAEFMTIRSLKMPGSEMKIVWKINVNEEGIVSPTIDLLPKVPEQVLAIDNKDVIGCAPRCFRNMLHLAGIEASINNLVKTFCIGD